MGITMKNTAYKSDETDKDYALYTETIVVKPSVRFKWLLSGLKLAAAAVLFGCIASVVMVFMYPWLQNYMNKQGQIREPLAIDKDEYPSDLGTAITDTDNENEPDDDEAQTPTKTEGSAEAAVNAAFKTVVDSAQKSMVIIDSYSSDDNMMFPAEKSTTETVGIVVGEANLEYIILTDSAAITDSASIIVRFSDVTEVGASLLGMDAQTGIAVLAVKQSELPYNERSAIKIAQLDNSYAAKQGDIIVAAGKLYGKTKAVDYGMITDIQTEAGTDNTYEILSTGIAYQPGDYSYVFNLSGNVIGISNIYEDSMTVSVLGISDLKSMIEALSDGTQVAYFGIQGQNVTNNMASAYNMPLGVYVTDVLVDSPAFEAGLQAGDIITEMNGNIILTIQSFSEKLYQCSVGQEVTVTVRRPDRDEYRSLDFTVSVSAR